MWVLFFMDTKQKHFDEVVKETDDTLLDLLNMDLIEIYTIDKEIAFRIKGS